jgi:hypothetical protein
MTSTPIFKHVEPDYLSAILKTRFDRFESHCGIQGLMRLTTDPGIELLAIHAKKIRTGQFRTFIQQLKQEYRFICIWHIDNPWLENVLARYGFLRERIVDEFGDPLTGMRWDAVDNLAVKRIV